jgi:hypothetical protein
MKTSGAQIPTVLNGARSRPSNEKPRMAIAKTTEKVRLSCRGAEAKKAEAHEQ